MRRLRMPKTKTMTVLLIGRDSSLDKFTITVDAARPPIVIVHNLRAFVHPGRFEESHGGVEYLEVAVRFMQDENELEAMTSSALR
jgi:hypothetical protein